MNAAVGIVKSLDTILFIWAFSVVIGAVVLVHAIKQIRRNWKRIGELAGEEGFAYTLSFIMTSPFVILLFATIVETTFMLITRTGVFLATYAAARSAIVWETAQPAGLGKSTAERAAVHVMTPFASGNPNHQIGLNSQVQPGQTFAYMGLYHRYCPDGPLGDGYLMNKLVYAHHATRLDYTPPAAWDANITVSLRYEHPFHWRIVGKVLGHPAPWGGPNYTYTLKDSVTLQNEGARNETQSIGIQYDSTY